MALEQQLEPGPNIPLVGYSTVPPRRLGFALSLWIGLLGLAAVVLDRSTAVVLGAVEVVGAVDPEVYVQVGASVGVFSAS